MTYPADHQPEEAPDQPSDVRPENTADHAGDPAPDAAPAGQGKRRQPRRAGPRPPRSAAGPRKPRGTTRRATAAGGTAAPTRPARQPRLSGDDTRIRNFATAAARLLHDSHCQDVLVFDVRGLSDVTDYIVIGSGTSDRQTRSVGDEVEDLAAESGLRRFGRDADARATWVVLDFVDVVVHLFEPVARAHYDLEMLWGDAPRLRWQRRNAPAKESTRNVPADA